MTTDEVSKYFGSDTKASRVLGITRQSFSKWRILGFIPALHQLKIQELTKGKLKATAASAVKKGNKDD